MITGGSPTMSPIICNEVNSIFKEIHGSDQKSAVNWWEKGIVTLETEGSHPLTTTYPIDLVSLSPKFSNSIPKLGIEKPLGGIVDEKFIAQHNKFRLNKPAMQQLINDHKNYHFKPVCNPVEQPEIWAEIEQFRNEMNIPKNKTWIMPPGATKDEIIRVLPDVINFCSENGYNFSGRDHIIAFGETRCK